jgi:hypothetical protein
MIPTSQKTLTSSISEQDIAQLPTPVKRYLRHTGVIGYPPIQEVRLTQRGSIRLKPDSRWMSLTARQTFTVQPPSFDWYATTYLGPLPMMTAHDSYHKGQGRMHIKLGGIVTVGDASGDTVNQGAMLRFLGEICWFPTAWLSPYLRWQAIDNHHARVTMTDGTLSDEGILTFNDEGGLLQYEAHRYQDRGNAPAIKLPWIGKILSEGTFQGLRIPSAMEGIWRQETGDFPYVRLEVTEVEYW